MRINHGEFRKLPAGRNQRIHSLRIVSTCCKPVEKFHLQYAEITMSKWTLWEWQAWPASNSNSIITQLVMVNDYQWGSYNVMRWSRSQPINVQNICLNFILSSANSQHWLYSLEPHCPSWASTTTKSSHLAANALAVLVRLRHPEFSTIFCEFAKLKPSLLCSATLWIEWKSCSGVWPSKVLWQRISPTTLVPQ